MSLTPIPVRPSGSVARFVRLLLAVAGCLLLACQEANPISAQTATTPRQETLSGYPGSKVFIPSLVPAPAIILLHGSEGGKEGSIEELAKTLRDAGFVTMSLCYYGCMGMPDKLTAIPLERVLDAAMALKQLPAVHQRKVGLFGWSRGAEQSLLLASLARTADRIAAVAVHAPFHAVVSSWDPETEDCVITDSLGRKVCTNAWTWYGQPLGGGDDPFGPVSGPDILIENYQGPVYLSHGTADDLWPVQESETLAARRRTYTPRLHTEAHYWQGEGHMIEKQANVDEFNQTLTDFFKQQL